MPPVTTVNDIRRIRATLRGEVALVPTMGAMHGGHLKLIERAQQIAHHVIVSIFVNPAQFAPHEDFEQYPRPIERDLALCEQAGVEIVFAPTADQIYPPHIIDTQVTVPQLTQDLEASMRPGFFDGVLRVVAKLFHITQPTVACFGKKDYQQLRVIEAMVDDLHMPIRIEAVDTVREPDGLALSSRNVYLPADQRKQAAGVYKSLCQAQQLIEQAGETDPAAVERAMTAVLKTHQLEIDYVAVRHPLTLQPLDCLEPSLTGGVVALVAARLAGVRLIDNLLLGVPRLRR